MRTYILSLILLIGLPTLTFSQSNTYPQIKSLKGFLFYNQNKIGEKSGGTLSENIIDNKDFYLWNTIIGEGSAKGTSQNTLIVVEIINNPKEHSINGNVRLTVTDEKNKVIFTQVQDYSIFEKGNIFSAPFLLYETGCGNIKIKAELLDKSKKKVISKMEKSIEFNCGE